MKKIKKKKKTQRTFVSVPPRSGLASDRPVEIVPEEMVSRMSSEGYERLKEGRSEFPTSRPDDTLTEADRAMIRRLTSDLRVDVGDAWALRRPVEGPDGSPISDPPYWCWMCFSPTSETPYNSFDHVDDVARFLMFDGVPGSA